MRSWMWGRLLICWLIRGSGWRVCPCWDVKGTGSHAVLCNLRDCCVRKSFLQYSVQEHRVNRADLSRLLSCPEHSWALLQFQSEMWRWRYELQSQLQTLHFLENFMHRENHSIMQHHGYAGYEVTAPKLLWWQSIKLKHWGRTKEIFTRARWTFCTRLAVSKRCGLVKISVFPRSVPATLKLMLEKIQKTRMNFLLFHSEQETVPVAKI